MCPLEVEQYEQWTVSERKATQSQAVVTHVHLFLSSHRDSLQGFPQQPSLRPSGSANLLLAGVYAARSSDE